MAQLKNRHIYLLQLGAMLQNFLAVANICYNNVLIGHSLPFLSFQQFTINMGIIKYPIGLG